VVDDAQLAALRAMVDRRRSLGEDHPGMILSSTNCCSS
jgi:hypothetical protein